MDKEKAAEDGAGSTSVSAMSVNESLLSDINISELIDESVLQLLDEPFDLDTANSSKLRVDNHYAGFDASLGNSWIYPTNLPIRKYQFDITRVALFRNTLVVLPTGLGKTFIAAVVMYNMFRWYPTGKIIFMAPTRPLVAQQIEACYQIMGIPKDDTAELTGKQNKKNRKTAWHTKRVFYCTPQVVQLDINDPEIEFPINDVKLVVIDEAHKAKGKYAYTDVVSSIAAQNKLFRILALSATPGRGIKDVADIVQNLLISHIEVRSDQSIDVAPYTFKKNIKTVVVPLGSTLKQIRDEFVEVLDPYVRTLMECKVISGHTGNLSKGWLIMEKQRYLEAARSERHPQHSKIVTNFAICVSMFHALELLERHGIRVFLNFFDGNEIGSEEKYFVKADSSIRNFLEKLRTYAGPNLFAAGDTTLQNNTSLSNDLKDFDYGHPKFQILQKYLTEHFQTNPESRSIIFCEYRESVFLLNHILLQNRPLIKPKAFVGQGTSKNVTVTQKEQIAIMKDFRIGVCNTLIATCVAEEGIDVGEVDLIICFDINNKNPTRFVQRIGRTGRKRQGKVIMLVTEGKEKNMLKNILATKDETNHKIGKSSEIDQILYRQSPRLIPPEFNPKCVQTFIKIQEEKEIEVAKGSKAGGKKSTRTKKSPPNKKKSTAQAPKTRSKMRNMREFFQPVDLDDQEQDIFDAPNRSHHIDRSLENVLGHLNETIENNPIDMGESSNRLSDIIQQPQVPDPNKNITFEDKLAQLIQRYRAIKEGKKEKPPPVKIIDVIFQDKLPNAIKLSFLKNDLDFVQKNYEAEADTKIKKAIEQIFGSKKNVQIFLNRRDSSWKDIPQSRKEVIFKIVTAIDDAKATRDLNDSNGALGPTQSNRGAASTGTVRLVGASQVNYYMDPELDLPVFFDNESKYESQRDDYGCDEKKFAGTISSTPIKVPAVAVVKLNSPRDSPIKNSPIARAFERSFRKSRQLELALAATPIKESPLSVKSEKQPSKIEMEVPHHLKYLGLTCIDDLFCEAEYCTDAQPCSKKRMKMPKADESYAIIVNRMILNPSISTKVNGEREEISDLFADDANYDTANLEELDEIPNSQCVPKSNSFFRNRSHCTVSQILKICEDEDKKYKMDIKLSGNSDKENRVNNNSIHRRESNTKFQDVAIESITIPKSSEKKLFIGSIADMFSDDSDTSIVTTEKNRTKSDSDRTEEYSFDEVICSSQVVDENIFLKKKNNNDGAVLSSTKSKMSISNVAFPSVQNQSEDMFAIDDSHKSNRTTMSRGVNGINDSIRDISVRTTQTQNGNLNTSFSAVTSMATTPPRVHSSISSSIQERSPSIFCRRPNLSRLRVNDKKDSSFQSIKETTVSDRLSSPFSACKPSRLSEKIASCLQSSTSDDDFETSADIRDKLGAFKFTPNANKLGSTNGISPQVNNTAINLDSSETPDEDEVFGTCKSIINNMTDTSIGLKRKISRKPTAKSKRKKCLFIDDEAGVSGDDSTDEDEDDFFTQMPIGMSQDEGDPNIDMHAKYLQSIRSPIKPACFKIPAPGYRNFVPLSEIYSQQVPIDDTIYGDIDDSFVVRSDEEVNKDESEEEMCELERAEMILKQQRQLKRKKNSQSGNADVKRRRRIIVGSSDSE